MTRKKYAKIFVEQIKNKRLFHLLIKFRVIKYQCTPAALSSINIFIILIFIIVEISQKFSIHSFSLSVSI